MENVLERTRREPQPGSWDRKAPGARWGGWTGWKADSTPARWRVKQGSETPAQGAPFRGFSVAGVRSGRPGAEPEGVAGPEGTSATPHPCFHLAGPGLVSWGQLLRREKRDGRMTQAQHGQLGSGPPGVQRHPAPTPAPEVHPPPPSMAPAPPAPSHSHSLCFVFSSPDLPTPAPAVSEPPTCPRKVA